LGNNWATKLNLDIGHLQRYSLRADLEKKEQRALPASEGGSRSGCRFFNNTKVVIVLSLSKLKFCIIFLL
jgi:hypothetical protein